MKSWIIGVDEVGRGPLAGPVGVGVACVTADFDWEVLPGVTDSKKLSAARREEIFTAAKKLRAAGGLNFAVAMVSASVIDRIGIVPAINQAMRRALKRIDVAPEKTTVKLDGGLKAPAHFLIQETIIKGDAKEQAIGLASIVAKVTRDQHVARMAKRFPEYGLEQHKGYGTKAHRAAIADHGLSAFHRRSFCSNCLNI